MFEFPALISILVTQIQTSKTKKSSVMKIRARKIVNFFAFNLLFFALYLNFIHRDKATTTVQTTQSGTSAFNGTTPVENPEIYLNKVGVQQTSNKATTE